MRPDYNGIVAFTDMKDAGARLPGSHTSDTVAGGVVASANQQPANAKKKLSHFADIIKSWSQ